MTADTAEYAALLEALAHDLPNGGEMRIVSLTRQQLAFVRRLVEQEQQVVEMRERLDVLHERMKTEPPMFDAEARKAEAEAEAREKRCICGSLAGQLKTPSTHLDDCPKARSTE